MQHVPVAPPLERASLSRRTRRRVPLEPYLYLLPTLLTVLAWVYVPVARTVQLSFVEWNLLPTAPQLFVGWQNYARLLMLPELPGALWNTLLYVVGLWPIAVALPLAIALLTERVRGGARAIYRGLIFLPMVLAPVVVAAVWRWLLSPTGIVNAGLGLEAEPLRFLRDPNLALWTIVFVTGWKLIGFSTLIFSSAISGLDRQVIEAARLDGASEGQVVRHIVLPLVSPTTLFLTTLTILLGAQWSFVYINVLTQGGPLGATTNIYHLLYQYGFGNFAVGWSSAAAVILLIGFGALAWLCQALTRRLAFFDS
jgi:multiple sugar transport system permease protein